MMLIRTIQSSQARTSWRQVLCHFLFIICQFQCQFQFEFASASHHQVRYHTSQSNDRLASGLEAAPYAGGGNQTAETTTTIIETTATQTISNPTTIKPNYIETSQKITRILDRFMKLGYDKRVRPNYGGAPVEVNVTMRILSISSVSEVQMDFTADFYFRQTWHDPRLAFERQDDIKTLYVGAEVSKKIWLPDTFFGNEKLAYFHIATTENVFLRIEYTGEVFRSIRLTVTSSCPMNLQYFPMDRQRCTIEAESYGYDVKDIIYRWTSEKAVEIDDNISLPQFDIKKIEQKYRLSELSSGTYSRLIAELHFARRMGYYLIQIYVPSSLTVVISWVSFWLHRNASPARVQLGVTTVLTMTTLMSSTNSALPKISYIKSIDIFLGTCFLMVFAALLEYATVGYLGKRIAMRKVQLQHGQAQAQARAFAQMQAQAAQGDSIPPTSSADQGQLVLVAGQPAANGDCNGTSQPATRATYYQQESHTPNFRPYKPTDQVPEPPVRLSSNHPSIHRMLSQLDPFRSRVNPDGSSRLNDDSAQQQQHLQSCTCGHSHRSLESGRKQTDLVCLDVVCQETNKCSKHSNYNLNSHTRVSFQPPDPTTDGTGQQPEVHWYLTEQSGRCEQADKLHLLAGLVQEPAFGGQAQVTPGAQLMATAAAANLVNLHRRNKGLPPSTNPNFVPFSFLPGDSFGPNQEPKIGAGNRKRQVNRVDTVFGIRPSDIDKYSRVVFPVCFVCFQLMYWIIYLHISSLLEPE